VSTQPDTTLTWVPEVSGTGRAWAARLADAIAADVGSGRLAPGAQLPTQRALARYLGITVGTVNRAYALAERAGLVSAEVGRGTFVTGRRGEGIHDASLGREAAGAIELGLNYPAADDAEAALEKTLIRIAKRDSHPGLISLAPYAGRPAHRAAGARWLRRFGLTVSAEDVLVCTSVQHGLAATLAALAAPGDIVLTESLTSPGIKSVAAMHQLRLVGVDGDEHGVAPDALAAACRATGGKLFYTTPTLHTPTTITMTDDRRRQVAEVLAANQVIAIEDDAWGFLAGGAVRPLQTFAPPAVVYLTSVSKSLAPGLRVGYVVAPPSLAKAITSCIGTTTWTAPLVAEVVSEWIHDGMAADIVRRRVHTAIERQQLARRILGAAVRPTVFPTFHLWLPLPEPWRANDFVAHAGILGVSLAPPDTFVPGRAAAPHAIRLCIGTEADPQRVEQGLRTIAQMIESGPAGFSLPSV
jgi:DNA-binding transcriptional MocR family regulator